MGEIGVVYSVDGIVGGNEGTDMGIMRKVWIFAAFVGMMAPLACGGQGIEDGTPTHTAAIAPSPTVSASTPALEPTAAPTPTKVAAVSEATLPNLSLEYKGETIEGHRFEGCWMAGEQSDIQCVRTSPYDAMVDAYIAVEHGDAIAVRITPDSRPTKLLADVLTEPGNLSVVSGLIWLSPVEREFAMDTTPGRYNVWVTAQWFEGKADVQHKVSYVFGLSIAGEAELRHGCGQTLEGGDLDIVLDSLEDRYRTAVDAVNGGWCQFNKEIAQVRLILESNATDPYVEIFQVDPPSELFHLPLPEEFESERTGGPLPPGEYLRRIIAVAVDGSEKELDIGHTDFIALGREISDSGFPVIFPQHQEERSSYDTSTPEYIEGFLQIDERCMHIRRNVLVWPPDFSVDERDDSVIITDEDGEVVAHEGHYAKFKGRKNGLNDELGRRIRRMLPRGCPADRLWVVVE